MRSGVSHSRVDHPTDGCRQHNTHRGRPGEEMCGHRGGREGGREGGMLVCVCVCVMRGGRPSPSSHK